MTPRCRRSCQTGRPGPLAAAGASRPAAPVAAAGAGAAAAAVVVGESSRARRRAGRMRWRLRGLSGSGGGPRLPGGSSLSGRVGLRSRFSDRPGGGSAGRPLVGRFGRFGTRSSSHSVRRPAHPGCCRQPAAAAALRWRAARTQCMCYGLGGGRAEADTTPALRADGPAAAVLQPRSSGRRQPAWPAQQKGGGIALPGRTAQLQHAHAAACALGGLDPSGPSAVRLLPEEAGQPAGSHPACWVRPGAAGVRHRPHCHIDAHHPPAGTVGGNDRHGGCRCWSV